MIYSPTVLFRPRVLIIGPTRELVTQIAKQAQMLVAGVGDKKKIKVANVYGGSQMSTQRYQMIGADIMTATTGRLMGFIRAHNNKVGMDLSCVDYLILDEADRMLDMGFGSDIDFIHEQITEQRKGNEKPIQTLMFSATFPQQVQDLARQKMKKDNYFVRIGDVGQASESVTQIFKSMAESTKMDLLEETLAEYELKRILIFINTKRTTDMVGVYLADTLSTKESPVKCMTMHGDRSQQERETALRQFHSGEVAILVATDVVARGIDVRNVSLVINYDAPHEIDQYVHR